MSDPMKETEMVEEAIDRLPIGVRDRVWRVSQVESKILNARVPF